MAELSRVYDLDPKILESYKESDCPVFTSIIPYSLVDSFWLWTAVTEHTGSSVYYSFSLGNHVTLLFVDGNPENWESDFPKKGNKLWAAAGSKKKAKSSIKDVSVYPYKEILVIDLN